MYTYYHDNYYQETSGAAVHPSVTVHPSDVVLCSGLSASGLCYSAFRDADKRTDTGLIQLLLLNKIGAVYFAGLGHQHVLKVSSPLFTVYSEQSMSF